MSALSENRSINFSNSYMRYIPSGKVAAATEGLMITTAFQLLRDTSTNAALRCGALSVTATLVEAATRPVIRAILPNHPNLARFIQSIAPIMIVVGLFAPLAPGIQISCELAALIGLVRYFLTNNGHNFYGYNSSAISYVIL